MSPQPGRLSRSSSYPVSKLDRLWALRIEGERAIELGTRLVKPPRTVVSERRKIMEMRDVIDLKTRFGDADGIVVALQLHVRAHGHLEPRRYLRTDPNRALAELSCPSVITAIEREACGDVERVRVV